MREPTLLRSTALVARREFVERARDRSFLVSTGITLLLVLAAVLVPALLSDEDRPSYDVAFTGPGSGQVRVLAEEQAQVTGIDLRVVTPAPGSARTEVEEGRLDAVVEDGRVLVPESLTEPLGTLLQEAHREIAAMQRLREAGIDPGTAVSALAVPPLIVEAVTPPEPGADAREGVAFLGSMLLYGQLFGYGFWVALGVVEEKSSRVVEVLLATVPARALLIGKVAGIGLLGLAQLLGVTALGLATATATGLLDLTGDVLGVVALVLVWFVLGYAFYAVLFAASAARVSRQEDLQNVTTPLTLLILFSFGAAFYVANDPDTTVARVLSVLPPVSALANPPAVAGGRVGVAQVGLAVGLMLAAIAALVLVAARLYEGAILHAGAKVPLREAWRGDRTARRATSVR